MISAKIIADSISPAGVRITTFELEYPRFLHAEFMTHRMFSRNAASSRAIPVERARQLLIENPAKPIRWGKNQAGMVAKMEDIDHPEVAESEWLEARDHAINAADQLAHLGLHKQWTNRLLEPFTHIKVVCTATEFNNFWWLRNHPDAQPEIQELARVMLEEFNKSQPVVLEQGDWHVPYYNGGQWKQNDINVPRGYIDYFGNTLQEAIAISASCCAQVSYRKLDESLEKAQDIYKRLVESEPVHASPFEHQATPFHHAILGEGELGGLDGKGYTHLDREGNYWSGNFRGWIQNRQLIPNNVKRG